MTPTISAPSMPPSHPVRHLSGCPIVTGLGQTFCCSEMGGGWYFHKAEFILFKDLAFVKIIMSYITFYAKKKSNSVNPTFEPGRKQIDSVMPPEGRIWTNRTNCGVSFEQLPKDSAFRGTTSKNDEPPIPGIGKLGLNEALQPYC